MAQSEEKILIYSDEKKCYLAGQPGKDWELVSSKEEATDYSYYRLGRKAMIKNAEKTFSTNFRIKREVVISGWGINVDTKIG